MTLLVVMCDIVQLSVCREHSKVGICFTMNAVEQNLQIEYYIIINIEVSTTPPAKKYVPLTGVNEYINQIKGVKLLRHLL